MKSVIEKVLCVKIDKYYFKDPKGRILWDEFESIYNFVEERTVKQNLLTIMKI